MYEEILERATKRREINDSLTRLIAEGLDLPIAPEQIDDDQPLFGRGLELDSLDTLEIVSLVEEEFGVAITDEDKFVFGSTNSVADHIEREIGA
ncbi:acyl carrier protein [Leifsonia sp. McL0607]|uniref:acyl carrier protein n=1 Tax=Leifsonia sp. McL0607 TaxID=3415672 RepID=UPI003CEC06E5